MILQNELAGVVYGGFHGRQLNEHLAAVRAALHHAAHLVQMAAEARQTVQHLLGVFVRVGVSVLVRMPVGVLRDRAVRRNVDVGVLLPQHIGGLPPQRL